MSGYSRPGRENGWFDGGTAPVPPYPGLPSAPPPPRRGRSTIVIAAVAAAAVAAAVAVVLAVVLVVALTRHPGTAAPAAVSSSATPSAVTVTPSSPAPQVTVTAAPPKTIAIQPPASGGDTGTADSYVTDIWNTGIAAPASWVDSTGQQLCAAWEAGDTTSYTDQLLLQGGIYSYHLGSFDQVTADDLCPGTPGGP